MVGADGEDRGKDGGEDDAPKGGPSPDWNAEAAGGLIAIVGPTASGKTARAVRIAEAIGGEIVSVDSVQIYRGFDVGSGKPSADERARAVHHLVDVVDPKDPIDAARFAALARAAIEDITRRGKRPIVCGGTFLWVKAVLYGLAEAPAADPAIRARLAELAARDGRPSLHARLREVDPASADRLHPNDFVRVSRALEVFELTGSPLTSWQEAHAFASDPYQARLFAIAQSPEDLTARIEARVDEWLRTGWIEETEALVARGYDDARAMGSVGYRQVRAYLAGALPRADLGRTIVRATRIFARRQRTWLNHVAVRWLRDDSRDGAHESTHRVR